jgi:hypothetical protein
MNITKSNVQRSTPKQSQSKSCTATSTNKLSLGTTESPPYFYANTRWTFRPTLDTGWYSTALWTPSGSRIWTQSWTTADSCVSRTARESSYILKWEFSSKYRIWNKPVLQRLVGVEWFMSVGKLWIVRILFLVTFRVLILIQKLFSFSLINSKSSHLKFSSFWKLKFSQSKLDFKYYL